MRNELPAFHPEKSVLALYICMKANEANRVDAALPVSAVIEGPPGIGKSNLIKQIAKEVVGAEEGKGYTVLRGSNLSAHHLVLQFPDDGATVSFQGQEISFFQYQYGPLFRPVFTHPENAFINIEEVTQAPHAVQNLLSAILSDRTVADSLYLPKGIPIVGSMNPIDTTTGVYQKSAHLSNRIVHLAFGVDANAWCNGVENGWPSPSFPPLAEDWVESLLPIWKYRISAFIRRKQELLMREPEDEKERGSAWPSPRSWEMVWTVMAAADAAGLATDLRRHLISGCIGSAAAIELITFLEYQDLVDPEEYVRTGIWEMPEEADKKYAGVNAIIGYCASQGKKKTFEAGMKLLKLLIETNNSGLAASHFNLLFNNIPSGVNPMEGVSGEVLTVLAPAVQEMGL
jgi:hypothetical protein